MIRIGCCTNMNAAGPDGTGREHIRRLADMGFDYLELPLAEMCALPDEDFAVLVKYVERSGIRCEVCNNFFPKTMRLTGPDVDREQVAAYVETALGRAGALGAEHVVFGSGQAKNIPDGFSREQGYHQVVELLQLVSPVACRHQIVIVIEPLRRAECNLINSFAEGCQLVRDVGRDNIRMLVDFYHLQQEQEPVRHILNNGREFLYHTHFAHGQGRSFPLSTDNADYIPFAEALKAIGYNRRMSLEAYTPDLEAQAPIALTAMRQLLA